MDQFISLIKIVPLSFAALFPVINPLGTAIILLGMTGTLDAPTRKYLATKIAMNTFVLLSIVLLAGSYILSFFGLTIPIVQAAGGLILASMGWNMLNQKDTSQDPSANQPVVPAKLNDQLFYPFTFPVTVGPGSVAVTLTLSAHAQNETFTETITHQCGVVVGIFAVCIVVYFSLAQSSMLTRRLGPSGTKVLLRLMAFILVCLGAEIFWNGASTLIKDLKFKF